MVSPATVRQIHTSPSWQLEIQAQQSSLSRWSSRPVTKKLRFQLNQLDPETETVVKTVLRGDRARLEALQLVVDDYIQHLLEQPDLSSGAVAHPAQEDVLTSAPVILIPQGRLAHTLQVQARPSALPVALQLSTLQLFDLGTVLEASQEAALPLPTLERPATTNRWRSQSHWLRVAAVLVLTVGVTGTAIRVFMGPTSAPLLTQDAGPEETVASAPEPLEDQPDVLAEQPAEELPATAELRLEAQELETLDEEASSLASKSTRSDPAKQRNGIEIPTSSDPVIAAEPNATFGASTANAPAAQPAPLPELDLGRTATAQAPPRPAAPETTTAGSTRADGEIIQQQPASATLPSIAISEDLNDALERDRALNSQEQVARRVGRSDQAAAIADYMRQRWQASATISQPLEYTLTVDAAGKVTACEPANAFSQSNLSTAPVPDKGTSITPPSGSSQTFQLILQPNGSVQVL